MPTKDPSHVDDRPRIPLSVPHLAGTEIEALTRAVESNWIAPLGPELSAFESEFAEAVGTTDALATASGTAAIHLGLRVLGVGPGDEVLVSTLTFCASVNPILYLGARPVFVDSHRASWNVDPDLICAELDRRGEAGTLPAAVVLVHLYGQLCDMTPIVATCRKWGVPILEDAAEALGALHKGPNGEEQRAGSIGDIGIFSFDGSKIITTSCGGMLVSSRPELVEHARKLARQAREERVYYEHHEVGYNYRMSNLLAAFGRAQLALLPTRVEQRRGVYEQYRERLQGLDGIELQPESPWSTHSRWLTCLLIDRDDVTPEDVRVALQESGIESRPVWKPMHLQPVYREMGLESIGGAVAEDLFARGLCLPSSSSLSPEDVGRVSEGIAQALSRG